MMRVLIVDDNFELAENIAEILQYDGHSTDVATSAEEALPKAIGAALDVIITDYRLPGMTGAEFVRQFRGRSPHPYAVVISAYTDEGTINEAKSAGAMFVAKPIDFDTLCRIVREANA
jgi:CheY-like chemotaxis protein